MAISVRDIQEKEFATQAKNGYNVEEVDDFLDEIAEQLSALVRENLELKKQADALEAEVDAAKQAAEEAAKKTPEYNEKVYFDNLQKSMREAMIGAQRIADETKAEAEDLANATLNKAQADADKLTAQAQAKLEALTEQYEAMKASAKAFKADFSSMIESQAALLRDKTNLF